VYFTILVFHIDWSRIIDDSRVCV